MSSRIENIVHEVTGPYLNAVILPNKRLPAALPNDQPEYVCDSVKNKSWMAGYDIHGDGYIDATDMAAITPIRKNEDLSAVCSGLKFGIMLTEEVGWRLRSLIAALPAGPLTTEEKSDFLRRIDDIEHDALDRCKRPAKNSPHRNIAQNSQSRIVEMALRARTIVHGTALNESFGVGFSLAPWPNRYRVKGLHIGSIQPESAALTAGVRADDIILTIDGRPVMNFSVDGTLEGLYDPEQGAMRGMSGSFGSMVKLTLLRDTDKIDVTVERLIWSARTVGTPITENFWDGTPAPSENP